MASSKWWLYAIVAAAVAIALWLLFKPQPAHPPQAETTGQGTLVTETITPPSDQAQTDITATGTPTGTPQGTNLGVPVGGTWLSAFGLAQTVAPTVWLRARLDYLNTFRGGGLTVGDLSSATITYGQLPTGVYICQVVNAKTNTGLAYGTRTVVLGGRTAAGTWT